MASAGPHRTHNKATSHSLQGQIASKDSKIQELRRNITQLAEENAELKEDKRSLREYNDHLKKDFENLRRDLERERDENAKLRRHITEESKEDERTSRQVKELRSQVQSLIATQEQAPEGPSSHGERVVVVKQERAESDDIIEIDRLQWGRNLDFGHEGGAVVDQPSMTATGPHGKTQTRKRKGQLPPKHATNRSEVRNGPSNRSSDNGGRTAHPSENALGKRKEVHEHNLPRSAKKAKTTAGPSPISTGGEQPSCEVVEIDCSSPPRRGLPSGSLPDATGPPLPGPEPIPPQDVAFKLRPSAVSRHLKKIPKFEMPTGLYIAPIFTNHYLFRRCEDGIGNFVCRADRWIYGERLGKAPDSRHVLYVHHAAYPHAPSKPGESGLLIGGRNLRQAGPLRDDPPRFDWKDDEERGACQCVATLLLSEANTKQFQYMGEYKVTFISWTTGYDWTTQSISAQNHWTDLLLSSSSAAPFASAQQKRFAINMPPPLDLNGEDSDAIIKYAKRVLVESEIDMKKAYSEGQEGVPIFAMQCVGYDPDDFINHYYAYDFRGNASSKTTHSPSATSYGNGTSPSTATGSTQSIIRPSPFSGATSSTTGGSGAQGLPETSEKDKTRLWSPSGLSYASAEHVE